MSKIYIYEINRETLKKRLFRVINLGNKAPYKNLEDVDNLINYLDDEINYYTWEVK